MQSLKDQLEIYCSNIYQIAVVRELRKQEDYNEFKQEFFKQIHHNQIEVELVHKDQQVKTRSAQQKERLGCLMIYVQKKMGTQDVLKKHLSVYDSVIVFCEEGMRRQIKNKAEKELKSIQEKHNKRIDIFCFDSIQINLFSNKHSVFYSTVLQDEKDFLMNKMRLKSEHFEKIQINDPLLMYYGFELNDFIKEQYISDINYGLNELYMVVVPEMTESPYLNSVVV